MAAIGVFCDDKFNLNLVDVFLHNITLHMNGSANVQPCMWEALRMVERGVVNPATLFSHQFKLNQVDDAFKTFHEKANGAMKLLIRN